ncbi:MAG: DUF362 domain-containing protein [Desulfatibacillum sp.]|nr:DUF362 domain-containing protein [Desulfatibacillum sp.]
MSNTVIIKFCEEYDRAKISAILSQGMNELHYTPRGNVFVKPNVVFAYHSETFGGHAFTAPPFVGASLTTLANAPGVTRVDMGENSAVGLPTRLNYKHAGYFTEVKEVRSRVSCPVGIFCMDEVLRDSVFVGGAVHDNLRISRRMARADSKVYLPKLKGHCVSNMTGAVKLNIGICSDDERAIRHDFMLNEKIVDLLAPGYPDFIAMDAIDVGVGNEAFPTPRKMGLILMGDNPLAVDLVGARLLGYDIEDVAYLKLAVERGYTPASLDEVDLRGDITTLSALDEHAQRIHPYDDEFHRWQDVNKELDRLKSPIRFYFGPYRHEPGKKCLTGCVMGVKMFLGSIEKFAGSEAFASANPVVMIVGRIDETIDAKGADVFLVGSCAKADIVNARKIKHFDKCFTTASDLNLGMAHKLGMPVVTTTPSAILPMVGYMAAASFMKLIKGRYFQDMGHFLTTHLNKRV